MGSREEFFQEAIKLGITPEMAVGILRRNGVQGKYDVEKHDQYMKMLHDYIKILERLMRTVNRIESKYHALENCPVCGSPVERDYQRDGSLGEAYAWKCTSPEQGLVSHFIQYRLERIRPWMQRNRDMLDQETSLETKMLIESPSGENPEQISNEPSFV